MMGSIYRAADSVIVWLGREFQDHQDRTEDLLQGTWRLEYARENGTIPDEYLQRLVNDPIEVFQESQLSRIRLAAVTG
jgi:hypothetical protein